VVVLVVDKEFLVLPHLHRVELVVLVVVVVEEPIALLQVELVILLQFLQHKDKMVAIQFPDQLEEMMQQVAVVEQELQLMVQLILLVE
jgi:hypothetical protein